MIVDITVPELGESINEVEIGEWLVEIGDHVKLDDELVAVESDKATVEIPAPQAGVLVEILKKQGDVATIGDVVGRLDSEKQGEENDSGQPEGGEENEQGGGSEEAAEDAEETTATEQNEGEPEQDKARIMPAAARVMAEHNIDPAMVTATGPGGRISKEDAQRALEKRDSAAEKRKTPAPESKEQTSDLSASENRVPMTPIRRTIAARLLEAKQNMALLTTFNEADMSQVKKARSMFGEEFFKKYDVRLGFMSFFIKAAVAALADFPLVNSRIDGDDIIYHESCDIGVAIGGGKGLVVPVIRQAERMSFADIEKKIGELAEKAQKNTLKMEELQGGTFTISNGGVYGSMLSTPIVNPPQSAILGLHAIKDRPMAIDGEVVIRPVMYLALTYDHRIIDGREAVSFLKSIKERIEQPQKMLLEI